MGGIAICFSPGDTAILLGLMILWALLGFQAAKRGFLFAHIVVGTYLGAFLALILWWAFAR